MQDFEKITKEALDTLVASSISPKALNLINYAVNSRNLMSGVVYDAALQPRPVGQYILHLYSNALNIYAPANDQEKQTIQVVALLMGMEAMRSDPASYGTRLLSDLDRAGVLVSRSELLAFMAQKGNWWLPDGRRNTQKYKLMRNNPVAVSLCCAHLIAVNGDLLGRNNVLPTNEVDANLEKAVMECFGNAPIETTDKLIEVTEKLLLSYAPIYFGDSDGSSLEKLINYLRSNGYYIMPFMGVAELRVRGGSATHALNTFVRLVELERPTKTEQIGRAIIAAIGMDIGDCGTFRATISQKKHYHEAGKQKDADGKRYDVVPVENFIQDDNVLPIGHGNKSAYMLRRYLQKKLTVDVEDAIDAHEGNDADNPTVAYQFRDNPYALRLHMAHILAMCLDDGGAAQ